MACRVICMEMTKIMNTTKLLAKLVIVFVAISSLCCFLMFFAEKKKGADAKLGLSSQFPVLVSEKDLEKANKIIKKYIKDNYPDYRLIGTSTMDSFENGRSLKVYILKKVNNDSSDDPEEVDRIRIYFDIEESMIEFRKKHACEIREASKGVEFVIE